MVKYVQKFIRRLNWDLKPIFNTFPILPYFWPQIHMLHKIVYPCSLFCLYNENLQIVCFSQWSQLVDIVQQVQSRPTHTKARVLVIQWTLLNTNNLYLGPPRSTSNSSDFFSEIGYYIEFSNMESKPNFA